MAPKKRPRKKITTGAKDSTSSSKQVVPPKKRRTCYYDPSLYLETPDSPSSEDSSATNKEIPEWFKLSIQILLLNFYPEGVAMLNNFEADYDALFKGAKIDAADYNFPDWESMLKSPQFKKHCLVYVDKRISYCKGFPLPRSASVSMRAGGNVWEIVPKQADHLKYRMQPIVSLPRINDNIPDNKPINVRPKSVVDKQKQQQDGHQSTSGRLAKGQFGGGGGGREGNSNNNAPSSSSSSSPRSAPRSPSLEREDEREAAQHNDSDREMPKLPLVIPAEAEKEEEKRVDRGEKSRSRTPTIQRPSTELPTPLAIMPRMITSALQTLSKEEEEKTNNNYEPHPNSNGNEAHNNKTDLKVTENDLVDVSNDEEELSPSTITINNSPSTIHHQLVEDSSFFRRFDVPPTWTKVLEENEDKVVAVVADEEKVEETSINNSTEAAECQMETEKETPQSKADEGILDHIEPEGNLIIAEKNDEDDDDDEEEMMILHDSAGSSPITPETPPTSRPPSPSPSPPPPRLSPQIIFEKNTSERVKERRQVMRDPRKLYISNSSLTLSEKGGGRGGGGITSFTNTQRNGPTTRTSSRPTTNKTRHVSDSLESGEDNSSSSSSSSASDSLILQEMEFMPWKCTVVNVPELGLPYLKALEKAVEEGRVQNVHRDPRLNIGRRAPHFTSLRPNKEGEKVTTGELEGGVGGEAVGVENPAPVNEKHDKQQRSGKKGENAAAAAGAEGERRVRVAMEEMAKSTGSRRSHQPEKNSDCEPNLSITIRNTHTIIPREEEDRQRIEMFVPLERVHQLENHLFIEDPIPQELVASKYLKFSHLWDNIVWRDRLTQIIICPRKFFNTEIFERWRSLKKRELTPRRMELVRELQKYEDKVFPSRCDFYLRSSLRMVELDYRTNHQFSEPTIKNGEKLVGPDEILFYVDFTGAPGGVVEFYNKSRKLNSKGFGVTYQKTCYNLSAIPDIYPDFFEPFYGKLNGYGGDGNLFNQETVSIFVNRVMEATDGKGVHIVSTLGNITRVVFEDGNDENWKFQHLAQTLVALLVLREGGNFALKMYDLKHAFPVGLVFLLTQCFESVRVCKLNIFAPTSAERVVVCLRKKNSKQIEGIVQFLKRCHEHLIDWYEKNKRKAYGQTIEELIPFATLRKHEKFMAYIRSSNERIKRTQIEELNSCLNNLRKTGGSIFTRGSYRALVARTTELWRVPSRSSYCSFKDKLVDSRNPLTAFRELRVPDNVCDSVEANLNEFNLYSIFSTTEHWRFSPVGNKTKTRGFYLGVEGIPHFFNMKTKEWIPFRDGNDFRLPSRSLLYGEIVPIFTKDGSSFDEVFVIIDALVLAGVEIKNLTYSERLCECEKFAMAVTKTFFPKMSKLVVIRMFDFMQLSKLLEGVVAGPENSATEHNNNNNSVKQGVAGKLRIPANSVYKLRGKSKEEDLWFNPSGMLFFEAGSKSKDFCSSLLSRIFWEWVETGMDIPLPKTSTTSAEEAAQGEGILVVEESRPIGSVSAKKLIEFAHRYS